MNTTELKGKVVIITGSGTGIGRSMAKIFLDNQCRVIINGRDPKKLFKTHSELKKISEDVHQICGDVSNIDEAKRIVEGCISEFGKIDIVINNAGLSMSGKFDELDLETYKNVIEVNLLGPSYISKFALPHLRKQKGSILFISSIAGIHGLPYFAPYSASKMGLKAITDSIKVEENNSGVHVGLIYVGFTQNDPQKTAFDKNGNLFELKPRKGVKKQTQESVLLSIIKSIINRSYISVLSPMGKVTLFLNRFAPDILSFILSKLNNKIKAFS